jgi:hypothetical protein
MAACISSWGRVMGETEFFTIRFSDNVNISNIADAHVLMSSALHCDKTVILDIGDVTEADLTFVQLIESARNSLAERGRSIRLLHAADGAVAQVLRRGGFLDPADAERADFWLQGTSK